MKISLSQGAQVQRARIQGARIPLVVLCLSFGAVLASAACSEQSQATLGYQEPESSGFVAPDASSEPDAKALTQYCPSDQCPAGHTTCPLSNFRCDINLLTDRNNCGACGVKCPDGRDGALFDCVNGSCAMACQADLDRADCDGVVDNGCETTVTSNDHCGACGITCSADKPCVDRSFQDYGCGCPQGDTYCPENWDKCIDVSADDFNCGECGKVCDPAEGGAPPPYANTYYGCKKKECGAVKCIPYSGDCDFRGENGCETSLLTNENCGACGKACEPGMECRFLMLIAMPPIPMCMCPTGQTFCPMGEFGGLEAGNCKDLSSDPASCGACGNACANDLPNGREGCSYGVCKLQCFGGWADCNGSSADGCETNANSDPDNCGGCGIRCDGISGQACVGGRCVVKPCDESDAGGPT